MSRKPGPPKNSESRTARREWFRELNSNLTDQRASTRREVANSSRRYRSRSPEDDGSITQRHDHYSPPQSRHRDRSPLKLRSSDEDLPSQQLTQSTTHERRKPRPGTGYPSSWRPREHGEEADSWVQKLSPILDSYLKNQRELSPASTLTHTSPTPRLTQEDEENATANNNNNKAELELELRRMEMQQRALELEKQQLELRQRQMEFEILLEKAKRTQQ